jgi:hypothetical protein
MKSIFREDILLVVDENRLSVASKGRGLLKSIIRRRQKNKNEHNKMSQDPRSQADSLIAPVYVFEWCDLAVGSDLPRGKKCPAALLILNP